MSFQWNYSFLFNSCWLCLVCIHRWNYRWFFPIRNLSKQGLGFVSHCRERLARDKSNAVLQFVVMITTAFLSLFTIDGWAKNWSIFYLRFRLWSSIEESSLQTQCEIRRYLSITRDNSPWRIGCYGSECTFSLASSFVFLLVVIIDVLQNHRSLNSDNITNLVKLWPPLGRFNNITKIIELKANCKIAAYK